MRSKGGGILLSANVLTVKGVGTERAKRLADMGIHTVGDIISCYPRDYEDRSAVTPIPDAVPERINTFIGCVETKPKLSYVKGYKIVKAKISGDGADIEAVWFNQPYLVSYFRKELRYVFTGKVGERLGKLQLENPEYEVYSENSVNSGRIIPVYRVTSGITQKTLRKLIGSVIEQAVPLLEEFLPRDILLGYGLAPLQDAVRNIHFPEDNESFYSARTRLAFNEIFIAMLSLLRLKEHIRVRSSVKINDFSAEAVTDKLPYELTGAQKRVLNDICADFKSGCAAARLIQGDVGCGKTAVAVIVSYIAINNGYQAVMMAPTEVLAKQHYESFSALFGQEIETFFLSGSVSAKEKLRVYEHIASGKAKMIIGTHALIEEKVEFCRPGLVITDEQHRFGVMQRLSLTNKGNAPHSLIMSATPIPRTLALMLYGDLDISVIDELPPGRQHIDTFAIDSSKRAAFYGFLHGEVKKGRQGYIICPAIEENEMDDMKAVVSYAEGVKRRFPDLRVALLHGRLGGKEKNNVMTAFAAHETDILVTTTVVEVGVNVPNATIMFIENAERFGLSQLHQLRGRVGRGSEKSYCILLSDSKAKRTKQRLDIMCGTNDGFEISEMDLKLRGSGDFFGTRQAGMQEFKIANLYEDGAILANARKAVKEICGSEEFKRTGRYPGLIEAEVEQYLRNGAKISI